MIWRHALKNATIPVLTVLGLQIGTLLGGAVITESVFAWPGMGKLVVDAIFFRDFPVMQTVLILSATIFIVINLPSTCSTPCSIRASATDDAGSCGIRWPSWAASSSSW